MRNHQRWTGPLLLAGALSIASLQAQALDLGTAKSAPAASSLVEHVKQRDPGRWGVRQWRKHDHYGNVVAGIALGTILSAAAAAAAPPSPELCWYWTNRRHTHGYWDYC